MKKLGNTTNIAAKTNKTNTGLRPYNTRDTNTAMAHPANVGKTYRAKELSAVSTILAISLSYREVTGVMSEWSGMQDTDAASPDYS
jgi:hypothetical protein